MDKKDPNSPQRRNFIEKAAGVTAGLGLAAATWPFIDSMNPTASDLSNATTRVNIEDIGVGDVKTVEWRGKPVFIFHRTPEKLTTRRHRWGVTLTMSQMLTGLKTRSGWLSLVCVLI